MVPKPYPPLFQAFSASESTIRWCSREGITPLIILSRHEQLRHLAQIYAEEVGRSGRWLPLGSNIGVLRQIYFGDNVRVAVRLAENGIVDVGYKKFWGHFGFWEAFRFPEDEFEYPSREKRLPPDEWTVERMMRTNYLYAGSVDDVVREIEPLVDAANPEWFAWLFDQGLLPQAELRKQLEIFRKYVLPRYR